MFVISCFLFFVTGFVLFLSDMQNLGEVLVDKLPQDQDWIFGILGFDSLNHFRLFANEEISKLTVQFADKFNVTQAIIPVSSKNSTSQIINQALAVVNTTISQQVAAYHELSPLNYEKSLYECVSYYGSFLPRFINPILSYLCVAQYALLNIDIDWSSIFSTLSGQLFNTSMSIANFGSFLIQYSFGLILNLGIALSTWLFYLILYFTAVDFMLADQQSSLHRIIKILPLKQDMRSILSKSVTQSIEGVFLSSIKICIYHVVFTWLLFDLFGVKFAFTYSFLSGILTFLPVFSPGLLGLPAALNIYINTGNFFTSLLLACSYFLVVTKIESTLYNEEKLRLSSFWTGFAAVFGITAFGVKGFFLGPLIFSLTTIVFDIVGENTDEVKEERMEEDPLEEDYTSVEEHS